jgi:TnpA family transposase
LRRRLNIQLKKGEALHSLREFLFFVNLGKIRRQHEEDQAHQTVCLNSPINCVIVWNTVYMVAALDRLRMDWHPAQ